MITYFVYPVGAKFEVRYTEDFGRDRGYAHSWGVREQRGRAAGTGLFASRAAAEKRCDKLNANRE